MQKSAFMEDTFLGCLRGKAVEKIPSHVVTIGMTSDDRAEGNGSYVGAITTWLNPYTGIEAFCSLTKREVHGEVWSPLKLCFQVLDSTATCWYIMVGSRETMPKLQASTAKTESTSLRHVS